MSRAVGLGVLCEVPRVADASDLRIGFPVETARRRPTTYHVDGPERRPRQSARENQHGEGPVGPEIVALARHAARVTDAGSALA